MTKVPVVNKTNWEDFQVSSVELQIPSTGEHTLKIVSSSSANISDIIFTKISDETTPEAVLPTTSKLVSQTKDEKQVEQEIISCKNDKDPKGATFGKLCLKVKKSGNKSIKFTWRKVKGGATYVVYGAKCGTSYRKIGSVDKNTFTNKKLKKGTYYKYMVVAQNSKGKVVTISKLIHVATAGGKVGNCKKIKVSKSSIILKSKDKFKLMVKQIAPKKKLKIKNHRKIAFESTNEKVAVVSKNGVIQAKDKGKCLVYVYAQNYIYKKNQS